MMPGHTGMKRHTDQKHACSFNSLLHRASFTVVHASMAIPYMQAAKLQQMSLKPKAADGEGKLEEDDEEVGGSAR